MDTDHGLDSGSDDSVGFHELDAPPLDFAEHIFEALAEECALPHDALAEVDPLEEAFGPVAADVDDADEFGDAMMVAAVVDEQAAAHAKASLVESAIAESVISAMGYVACTVEPWHDKPYYGRVTVWPPNAIPSRQNLAIRCYMHPSCSLSRKRNQFDDSQLLQWLYSATPLAARATADEKRLAKDQHMAQGKVCCLLGATRKAQRHLPARPVVHHRRTSRERVIVTSV